MAIINLFIVGNFVERYSTNCKISLILSVAITNYRRRFLKSLRCVANSHLVIAQWQFWETRWDRDRSLPRLRPNLLACCAVLPLRGEFEHCFTHRALFSREAFALGLAQWSHANWKWWVSQKKNLKMIQLTSKFCGTLSVKNLEGSESIEIKEFFEIKLYNLKFMKV